MRLFEASMYRGRSKEPRTELRVIGKRQRSSQEDGQRKKEEVAWPGGVTAVNQGHRVWKKEIRGENCYRVVQTDMGRKIIIGFGWMKAICQCLHRQGGFHGTMGLKPKQRIEIWKVGKDGKTMSVGWPLKKLNERGRKRKRVSNVRGEQGRGWFLGQRKITWR